MPSVSRREMRPPASVFSDHNEGKSILSLRLLDFLGVPRAASPLDHEKEFAPAVVNLAQKGRKFADVLIEHRAFSKARQAARSHRRAMSYNRLMMMEPEEGYRVGLGRYRERALTCRQK